MAATVSNDTAMRVWWLPLMLCACDRLFGLDEIRDASVIDAVVPDDAVPDDAAPDAPPPDAAPYFEGCADGTREGFMDPERYPVIAACAGAWDVPGLRPAPPVSCQRMGGNNGARATGVGCSATDLCLENWHVCRTALEVLEHLPLDEPTCAGIGTGTNMFFAVAQSGPGSGQCTSTGTNDLFGCGTYGIGLTSCLPLTRNSGNQCSALTAAGGWVCPNEFSELTTVTKTMPLDGGGVLCCRD